MIETPQVLDFSMYTELLVVVFLVVGSLTFIYFPFFCRKKKNDTSMFGMGLTSLLRVVANPKKSEDGTHDSERETDASHQNNNNEQ